MAQGVEAIVATPHFYASRDRIETFLARRQHAYEELCAKLPDRHPEIHIGAEVAFFPGISRSEGLEALTVDGRGLLLLEMPFAPWTSSDIAEVERLAHESGMHIMLAHLERYFDLPRGKERIEQLLELPVTVQINAESLLDWKQRRRLVRMFRDGEANVLGSDCHSLHRRPPRLGEGRAVLEKKLGTAFLEQLDLESTELLKG